MHLQAAKEDGLIEDQGNARDLARKLAAWDESSYRAVPPTGAPSYLNWRAAQTVNCLNQIRTVGKRRLSPTC